MVVDNLDKTTLGMLLAQGIISQGDYNKLIGNDDTPTPIEGSVKAIVNKYEDYLKKDFSMNTVEGYVTNVKSFLEYVYGVKSYNEIPDNVNLKEMKRKDIIDWLDKLASTGYMFASMRRFKHSLKNFNEYLAKEHGVNPPNIDTIEIPDVDAGEVEIDAFRDDEIEAIADCAVNLRNKAMLLFMYETGMRRQELIDCKLEHVNFDLGQVQIYANDKLDRIGYFTQRAGRCVRAYLHDWDIEIDEINETRKVKGTRLLERSQYLFQTARSDKISYSTIFKAIKDASYEYFLNYYHTLNPKLGERELAELAEERSSKINTETLRHSRRAWWFSEGKEVSQVQVIMGDENRHICKRYLKIAQQLYPEKFA